jgi:hypothetical protein
VEAQAKLTHGQVISALVGNRLDSPAPLYQVEDWAKLYAAEEVFGTPATLLNDDRIGRALDAIYPQLETLKGSVAWRAILEFGIDTAVWHWDFTSLSFHGAYEDQDVGRHVGRLKTRRRHAGRRSIVPAVSGGPPMRSTILPSQARFAGWSGGRQNVQPGATCFKS